MKALLIIDMIRKDVDALWNKGTIVKNQLKLMEAFRKKGCKIILIVGKPSGRFKQNPVMMRLWGDESRDHRGRKLPAEQIAIVPELMRGPHDLHMTKPEYSAFFRTDLESYLRKHKIDEVYLAGIFAGCCVYFTGADAAMRGIQPYIITDAVASPDRERTRANIENFKTFMGPAVSTDKLIATLKA